MSLGNASKPGDLEFWMAHEPVKEVLAEAWSQVSLKIRKILRTRLALYRIHTNGQTISQLSSFHKDSDDPFFWSCIIFTSPIWTVEWGGEFVLYNPVENCYKHAAYVPNHAIVFPSVWEHKGNSPLTALAGLRTSLAFCFTDSEHKNTITDWRPY
jgi:hypothetical protein